MDLKDKIKQLINRQGSLKSPTSPEGPTTSTWESKATASSSSEQDPPGSPGGDDPTDDDVLSSVEDVYYTNEAFDASDHVLQKLLEVLDLPSLNVDDYESNQVTVKSAAKTLGLEANFNRRYIHQKLEHGLLRVWQDVQQKITAFLLGTDLSGFKFDEFIGVLDVVGRLIDIGEEFCGSKSDDLQD